MTTGARLFKRQEGTLVFSLVLVISFAACGGSGNFPAPPPSKIQFTSTPPNLASEGALYTYNVVANDSAGAATMLSLTTAPAGATLQGATLSWTPTSAQARVDNSFSITASSETGRQATQSWSISPNGTIRGSYIDTFWYATGRRDNPHDLTTPACSWCSFAALVPQQDGSVQTLSGVGATSGTFEIPNVPAGHFWLRTSSQPTVLYWTGSSSFDMGKDFIGRSPEQVATEFSFDLAGLTPWQEGDSLSLYSPNALVKIQPSITPAIGSTTFNASEQVNVAAIDADKADQTFILQYEPLLPPLTGQTLGPALAVPTFSVVNGGTTPVGGSLSSTPTLLRLNISGTDWLSFFNTAGPSTAMPYMFQSDLSVQPIVTNLWAAPRIALVRIDPTTTGPAPLWDLGSVQYNDPFPVDWLRVFAIDEIAIVQVPVPGSSSTMSMPVAIGSQSTQLPSGVISPLMSPIHSATVNGLNLFSSNTVQGTVTLSWSAPTGTPAFGYVISVYRFKTSATGTQYYEGPIATLCTGETSIVMPPDLLMAGDSYLFRIQARADSRANMESAPFRSAYPVAYADFVSAPVTIR